MPLEQRPPASRKRPAREQAGDERPAASATQTRDECRACPDCLARSFLLALLSVRIEHAASDPSRLLDLLCLDDEQLIAAIGGRRRQELRQRLASIRAELAHAPDESAFCRHHPLHRQLFGRRRFDSYTDAKSASEASAPEAVAARSPLLPAALHLHGGVQRLQRLLETPVVALVGASRASDYGMEMAAALARGLAASGASVASRFAGGVCAAAHLGVLEAGATPLAVLAGGIDVRKPASLQRLHRRLLDRGVAISELPAGFRPRRWSERASERTLAALASLVIVIEADVEGAGIIAARLASARGARVGALPGRVTSPGSRGPHALLREGAALVACPQDALDLLYGVGETAAEEPCPPGVGERELDLLERVGGGQDTLARICADPERDATLLALAELRCRGLLARGDGDRYLPRVSLDRTPRSRLPRG